MKDVAVNVLIRKSEDIIAQFDRMEITPSPDTVQAYGTGYKSASSKLALLMSYANLSLYQAKPKRAFNAGYADAVNLMPSAIVPLSSGECTPSTGASSPVQFQEQHICADTEADPRDGCDVSASIR